MIAKDALSPRSQDISSLGIGPPEVPIADTLHSYKGLFSIFGLHYRTRLHVGKVTSAKDRDYGTCKPSAFEHPAEGQMG